MQPDLVLGLCRQARASLCLFIEKEDDGVLAGVGVRRWWGRGGGRRDREKHFVGVSAARLIRAFY